MELVLATLPLTYKYGLRLEHNAGETTAYGLVMAQSLEWLVMATDEQTKFVSDEIVLGNLKAGVWPRRSCS